ncbi:hypothetical protein [Streptomyces sp. NPDC001056]
MAGILRLLEHSPEVKMASPAFGDHPPLAGVEVSRTKQILVTIKVG